MRLGRKLTSDGRGPTSERVSEGPKYRSVRNTDLRHGQNLDKRQLSVVVRTGPQWWPDIDLGGDIAVEETCSLLLSRTNTCCWTGDTASKIRLRRLSAGVIIQVVPPVK